MNELDKILEEIDNRVHFYDNADEPMMYVETVKDIIRKHMNDGWISVEDKLPEEKVNPITQDFYEYQVTANFGFGEDVRTYKYGNGHWWNGPGIVDKYVIAWREKPDPYRPERGRMK